MQPKITITFLSFLLFLFNSFIYPIQCTFLESIIHKPSLPSLRTTFAIPPSPSTSDYARAPAPGPSKNAYDPLSGLSQGSGPLAMQDADGDPIDIPINFNPFSMDLNHNQQEESSSTIASIFPDVKKTCESTDNPDLCLSSLKPFLLNGGNNKKLDTFSLLEMQVKSTIEATQLALDLSTKKFGQSDSDMDILRDCKEMYDSAMDNLSKALKALKSKDVGTVNSMLSATISDFGTCDDGVQENGGTSPLVGYGDKLTKLVSNCLATVSLIKDNGATT